MKRIRLTSGDTIYVKDSTWIEVLATDAPEPGQHKLVGIYDQGAPRECTCCHYFKPQPRKIWLNFSTVAMVDDVEDWRWMTDSEVHEMNKQEIERGLKLIRGGADAAG